MLVHSAAAMLSPRQGRGCPTSGYWNPKSSPQGSDLQKQTWHLKELWTGFLGFLVFSLFFFVFLGLYPGFVNLWRVYFLSGWPFLKVFFFLDSRVRHCYFFFVF